MLLRPFIAATGLAAAANAFLLPPELSKSDIEVVEALPVDALWAAQSDAKAQTVNIECAGCPPVFKNHHGKPKKHHKQHPSHLELDFSIDQSRLLVNGFELYPNSDPFSNVLVAPQIAHQKKHHNKHHKDDEHNTKALKSHHKFRPHDMKPKAVEQQLGFSLQVQPAQTTDDVLDLIFVDLQIIEVGSIFVDSLPNVRVHLIKSPENELLIAKIEQIASENTSNTVGNGQECTTILCKWRAIIAAQMAKMNMHGCAGMLGHKAGHSGHHSQHHGQNPGHMTHHRHQHGWALLFRKLTSHIILPVLVGIVAGVTVSILGMIVGTILVGLWRKVVRGQSFFPSHTCRRFGRSSHRHHHKAPQHEAALAEEKSALMASQEDEELPPPPSYEDEVAREHV
ncbi:hypothetical protein N0V82_005464 [Gnomoniopsis sp. IMI 355080]|nr:hypothetical protein N0V82_005464 [Gnomoniopsis sp. IMI 355080]